MDGSMMPDSGTPDTSPSDTGADAGSCLSGALAWWRGEQNAADELGMNNLNPNPNAHYSMLGRVGSAFDIDGATLQSLNSQSAPGNWDASPGFTVEGWFNTNQQGVIMQQSASNVLRWSISVGLDSQSERRLHVTLVSANFDMDVPLGAMDAGLAKLEPNWNFFAVACANQTLTIALNQSRHAYAVSGCKILANGPYIVGKSLNGTEPLIGLVDELAIFNRGLTDAEVDKVRTDETAGKLVCRKQ